MAIITKSTYGDDDNDDNDDSTQFNRRTREWQTKTNQNKIRAKQKSPDDEFQKKVRTLQNSTS